MSYDPYLHHQALVGVLGSDGTFDFGDHIAPDTDPPYVVGYLRNVAEVTGAAAAPDEMQRQRFQTTAVGRTASEAIDYSHKAHLALQDGIEVAGRFVQRIEDTGFEGVTRDEDGTETLFAAVHHYAFWSFPA